MKRFAKDKVTPFWELKTHIYLGRSPRESPSARAPTELTSGLAEGTRVNLPERYDYP